MNMTVNGTSISTFDAVLLSVDYGYSTVTTYSDWLRGAHQPLFFEQTVQYTTAQYSILVEGDDLGDLEANCSNLYAAIQKSLVKVEGCDWGIDGWVTSADDERINHMARIVTVSFQGIKVADRETLSHTMAMGETWTFTAKGNQEVPCVITISPDMGYLEMDLTINGVSYPIKNIMSTDIAIVIDSEKGTITADGDNKIEDYEAWSFPVIKGGSNTLYIGSGTPTISIAYNGRWM